jgi:hypothetical protein
MELKRTLSQVGVTLLSLVFWASSVEAAKYFRYKDENGKTVLALTIPSDLVSKGYEIINDKGRVVERVAPALTVSQIEMRDAKIEAERQAELDKKRQDEIDRKLLKLYSQPEDAIRVLDRKIEDVEGLIKSNEAKIESIERQVAELEEKAAERQRKGMGVPDRLTVKLNSLEKDKTAAMQVIATQQQSRLDVLAEFEKVIARLEVITGGKRSDH